LTIAQAIGNREASNAEELPVMQQMALLKRTL
jgi:hypothetical protein